MKKISQEEIIQRMKSSQPNRNDDFSEFVYCGYHSKGKIICPKHGEFLISPANYISGHSCKACSIEKSKQFAKTTEEFVSEAAILFPQYDYSKVNYSNALTEVEIICPKHGSFLMKPNQMLSKKQGCPHCAQEKKASTTEEFVKKAKALFSEYDYSKVTYYNNRSKVEIICPKHGSFFIKPNDLLNSHGCPRCKRSKNNEMIDNILTSRNIEHIMEFCDERCKYKRVLPFDCFVPKYNLLIEYQGEQHYEAIEFFGGEEELAKRQKNDKIKKEWCSEEENPSLLEIMYKDDIASVLGALIKVEE